MESISTSYTTSEGLGFRVEGFKVTGCMSLAAASPALPLRFEEGLGHGYLALPHSG